MKSVTWSQFKLQKVEDIKECVKVTFNTEVVGYFIARPEGAMIAKIEGLSGLINASRGY